MILIKWEIWRGGGDYGCRNERLFKYENQVKQIQISSRSQDSISVMDGIQKPHGKK